ncbi:O-antigen ligase family protein [Candidatus Enterococcus ferrettii]|uniref:O-antigen ligase-related domain-containing protein n=1 Tax=Candidatus Enterococcus ferrettii TaxID=2815324 RepID=A0ABV0EWH7_9ENTE|nr:O-antigen ligase family protein [Enterococcus sp. 665A]MBO1342773.1 O-antigen ligase family protein [Enterococcus sp. 665A]
MNDKFSARLVETLFDNSYFRIFNLVACLLYFIPSSLGIPDIVTKIAVVYGGLLAFNNFFIKRDFMKMKYWYLLCSVMIIFCITTLMNFEYNLIQNFYNFIYLVITFTVVFPIANTNSPKKIIKDFLLFNNVLVIFVFLATLISLVQFILLSKYQVQTANPDILARQGFWESRLFGVYTSPNIGSLFGFISVAMSIINVSFKTPISKKLKTLYTLNFIVQLLYFFLSSSRGTQISISVFVLFYLFLKIIYVKTAKHVRPNDNRLLRNSIIIGIILLTLVNLGDVYIKNGLGHVPMIVKQETNFIKKIEEKNYEGSIDSKGIIDQKNKQVVIEHSGEGAEVSSGRFTIWKAAIKAFKEKPILGYGDLSFYRNNQVPPFDEKKITEFDKSELTRANGYMHNGYLQVLLSIGGIGFLLIFIFYILNLKDIIFTYFTHVEKWYPDSLSADTIFLLLSLLVSIFANELVEAHILFNNRDVVSIVFWYSLGVISFFVPVQRGINRT